MVSINSSLTISEPLLRFYFCLYLHLIMKKAVPFFGLILIAFTACKKPITQPNSGLYRGSFFQIYDNGDTNGQGVAYLSLNDGNNSFQMSGDTNTGAPYACYGTYVINNSSKMTFNNAALVDVGFQPHYLLDTTYTYTFDNKNFTLEFVDDTTRYEYNLLRD